MLRFLKRTPNAIAVALAIGIAVAISSFTAASPAMASTRGQVYMVPGTIFLSAKGWQGNASFSFPTNTTSIFLHEDCPASFPVVVNGAFAFNGTGQTSQVFLGYNGPRIDENPPSYTEWGWHFYWPGGSPAGTTALFSLFCAKRE
jgi:hypothetical protein